MAEVARIFAKYYHNDRIGYFDKFINEQVIKIIKSLATAEELTTAASIQDKFPDSLKQHIQNLLNNTINNNNNNNNNNNKDRKEDLK